MISGGFPLFWRDDKKKQQQQQEQVKGVQFITNEENDFCKENSFPFCSVSQCDRSQRIKAVREKGQGLEGKGSSTVERC